MEKDILERIRKIRKNKKITLRALAKETGLTDGYLSRIENGDSAPPVSTLARIAQGLGVDISYFFLPENGLSQENPSIVVNLPADDQGRGSAPDTAVRSGKKYRYTPLAVEKRGKNMSPYILEPEFELGGVVHHNGENFLYVLEGSLEFHYGSKKYVLKKGSSIYYDGHIPHQAQSLGQSKAKLLVILYSYRK